MPVLPFAIKCTIQENELLALKDSVNGRLKSASVSNIPGFEYYLIIYPNGNKDETRGQVMIFLHLNLGNVKKVEADFTVLIESANLFFNLLYNYEETNGWGGNICQTQDFFNSEETFIVDGKCTIKVYGTFKFEDGNTVSEIAAANEQKCDGGELGTELWKEDVDKDFTIAVDGKDIKVHKLVLQTRSDVFRAMFNPNTKETIENKVEITDFSFNVVEAGVKMIYSCNISPLSNDEMMSLLQFFDKYNIPLLKNKVEAFLINQISAATVCRLANCSILTNSFQLKKKCMEFLMDSFSSKTYLSDIEILDKDFIVEAVQNMAFHTVEIQ